MFANRKWLALFVLAIALLAGFLYGRRSRVADRLIVLSVGQGDCAVFQNGGRTVLIDVGPATERMDAGERIVAPALEKLGVDTIDLILLSHPDSDHIGGLKALLARYSIGKIIVPACFRNHPQFADLPAPSVLWLARSGTVRVGSALLQIEAPVAAMPDKDNDGSMFVRIVDGGATAVFSGDAPMEIERIILGRLPSWKCQILHAGHHGSRTSTGAEWLRATSPSTLVISCGRNNRYGHPHKSVLDAARSLGLQVLRTDVDGDLCFEHREAGFLRVDAP